MKTAIVLLALVVSFPQQESDVKKEDSPEAAFDAYRLALESGDWTKAVKRVSPCTKKELFFNVSYLDAMSPEKDQERFRKIREKHGYIEARVKKEIEEKEQITGKELTREEKMDMAVASFKDFEAFLAEALAYQMTRRARYRAGIKNLKIEGDRASFTVKHVMYSWHAEAGGESVQKETEYDEELFARKYDGKWKLCFEEEWKDPKYKFKF